MNFSGWGLSEHAQGSQRPALSLITCTFAWHSICRCDLCASCRRRLDGRNMLRTRQTMPLRRCLKPSAYAPLTNTISVQTNCSGSLSKHTCTQQSLPPPYVRDLAGEGWTGVTCCEPGATCRYIDATRSACAADEAGAPSSTPAPTAASGLPQEGSSPPTMTPPPTPANEGCSPRFAQCGGASGPLMHNKYSFSSVH